MKYLITDIVWDLDYYVDENELELPQEVIVKVHMDADATDLDLEEALANAVSDSTGFCMFQFNFEPVKEKTGQTETK
jgi:hypothetical protein